MDYIYAIFGILAGLGVFLFAVKLLQDNMERIANRGIRDLFNKTNNNVFVGVGIGTTVTALVQSSGLTTVMIVGFVNAGIMTLYQAAAVIMGANIGTTITAQIAALQSFEFAKYAIGVTGVGVLISMFAKKDKLRSIGNIIGGLGMIFVGLQLMSSSMSVYNDSEFVLKALSTISNPFLLLLIGIVFTALVQSSSAITSILISMASAGLVIGGGGNAVLYIILGSNIGSCVTALLSSIGTTTNAKRASVIHLFFNVAGCAIFLIFLLIWSNFMDATFGKWFAEPGTQIAMFHTFFNIVSTLIFLPFIKLFVKLSELVVPKKVNENAVAMYLDKKFLSSPSIAIDLSYKEMMVMQDMAMKSLGMAVKSFIEKDDESIDEIVKDNEAIASLTQDITDYLVQISSDKLDSGSEKRISELLRSINYLQRISEMSDNVTKYTRKSIKHDLVFSEGVNTKLWEMYELINKIAIKNKQIILNHDYSVLVEIDELETETDVFRKTLLNDHIERLKAGTCKPENSSVFINLISNLERSADLLKFVAHSIQE